LRHADRNWHADCFRNRQVAVRRAKRSRRVAENRFRSHDPDVAPHPEIEKRGTAHIQTGEEIMASRQQNRGSWYVSGASRFLWTDYGALFGLIAVAGFAAYRAWF
jgi:hypothetical protein